MSIYLSVVSVYLILCPFLCVCLSLLPLTQHNTTPFPSFFISFSIYSFLSLPILKYNPAVISPLFSPFPSTSSKSGRDGKGRRNLYIFSAVMSSLDGSPSEGWTSGLPQASILGRSGGHIFRSNEGIVRPIQRVGALSGRGSGVPYQGEYYG